jgi:hypothetical protein
MSNHINPYNLRTLNDKQFHNIFKQYALIFSTALSTTCSANKDYFTVSLNSDIIIPESAVSCSIALYQASIWNSSPNIITGKNDMFYCSYDGVPIQIQLPQGQYSLGDIQKEIDFLIRLKYPNQTFPDEILFQFSGNESTQIVSIKFVKSALEIDFTPEHNINTLLGFNPGIYTVDSDGGYIQAQNVARINHINSYLILTSLVENGMPVNATACGIVAKVPILADPNSQINYEPVQPIFIQCDALIGKAHKNLWFKITNENLEPVICKEDWNITLVISYEM